MSVLHQVYPGNGTPDVVALLGDFCAIARHIGVCVATEQKTGINLSGHRKRIWGIASIKMSIPLTRAIRPENNTTRSFGAATLLLKALTLLALGPGKYWP